MSPTLAEQLDVLVEKGTPEAFIALVALVKCRDPDPEAVETWKALCEEPGRGPQLRRLLDSSSALTLAAYSLEGPPPADFRSRLLVQDLLFGLGKSGDEESCEILREVWRHHPVRKLRVYAGHGLLNRGDTAGLEAVAARVDEAREVELRLAVRAAFRLGPDTALERLGVAHDASTSSGERIVSAALYHLVRNPEHNTDPRWVELASRLRTRVSGASSDLRRQARDWLATLPKEMVNPTQQRRKGHARPRVDVHAHKAALQHARDTIVPLLEALRTLPASFHPASPSDLDALELRLGLLPASVRAWYEMVGGVDLRPHANRPEDALVISDFAHLGSEAEEEPDLSTQNPEEVVPFVLRLVPEPLTKAGYSAGPGFGVALALPGELPPDDPVLVDDPDGLTFLEHIRVYMARLPTPEKPMKLTC